jgi:hypothetical protein
VKTLEQIVQSCISSVSGGSFTDEGNIYTGKYKDRIHEARANTLREKYIQTRFLHPDWIQRYYPEYDEYMQDNKCVTKFKCPGFIDLGMRDGLVYVGSECDPKAFNRVLNIGELSTVRAHDIYSRNRTVVLVENGYIYIYSNKRIEDPVVAGVFSRPVDVPSFNELKDNYPIDPQSLMAVEDVVVQRQLMTEIRTPNDGVSDSSTPSIGSQK